MGANLVLCDRLLFVYDNDYENWEHRPLKGRRSDPVKLEFAQTAMAAMHYNP